MQCVVDTQEYVVLGRDLRAWTRECLRVLIGNFLVLQLSGLFESDGFVDGDGGYVGEENGEREGE
jgi:hypothetical protein